MASRLEIVLLVASVAMPPEKEGTAALTVAGTLVFANSGERAN